MRWVKWALSQRAGLIGRMARAEVEGRKDRREGHSLGVQNHLGNVVDLGRPRRRRRRRQRRQWLRILLERGRLRVRDHRLLDGLRCEK